MQQLRSKPGLMPLKIADVLWPEATMRAQDALNDAESPLLPAVLAAHSRPTIIASRDRQQQLDGLMARTADLIAEAGHKAGKSDSDGSWHFAPSGDYYRHVFVRDGLFVLGQVDRANPNRPRSGHR